MNAIERGIEAVYQLEDSELTTEALPDAGDQGRFMIVEAAEGGAGVLRRLQGESEAMSRVARKALEIIHVDPDTGEEDPKACVRGCYRCLLTYGNQNSHEQIDRRLAIKTLTRLLRSRTQSVSSASTSFETGPTMPPGDLDELASPIERALAYLRSHDLNQPAEVGGTIAGINVDLVYPQAMAVVIFLSDEHESDIDLDPLTFSGWEVMAWRPEDPFKDLVAAHPSVFGSVE